MNQFFRISFTLMAMMSFLVSGISGKGGAIARKAAATAIAVKTAKNSSNNNQPQPTSTPTPTATPNTAAPAPGAAAPTGLAAMQTSGQLVAVPLTKIQKIIKFVTSRYYPYRCGVFAGDYCNRLCSVICAPPL